ncbi:MAG TPA: LPXTG cell wall anchor domain-containing protein [Ilumatobacteraceae bacterium]|nr:LPXTG cell wall anchor domain-containing protein [Ilumatobacteraceae bacterium]
MNSHRKDDRVGILKRVIVGGALAAVALSGTLAFASAGATALGGRTTIVAPEVCYERVPTTEYQFVRPTFTTQYRWDIQTRTEKFEYKYVKETRERRRGSAEAAWGDWSAWTIWNNGSTTRWEADGYTNEGDHDGNGDNGTFDRDYRYVKVVPNLTRSYNPKQYTAWTSAGSTPWGTSSTPPANTETTQYVNKQTDPNVAGPPEFSGWLTTNTPPAGAGWVPATPATRPGPDKQGERIACPPPVTPEPTYTEWVDGAYKCDDTTVTQTRTKTVYGWTLAANGYDWVASEPVVTTETQTRALTAAEITVCPTVPRTIDVSAFAPVCVKDAPFIKYAIVPNGFTPKGGATLRIFAANGTLIETREVTDLTGTLIWPGASVDANGVATDWPGWKLADDGVSWIEDSSDAFFREQLTIEVTVNPTATAKVSYPPATDACAGPKVVPPTTVQVVPPTTVQVAAQAPATTQLPVAEVPAGGLPATGGSSWASALIALVALLGGAGLVRLSRRPTN